MKSSLLLIAFLLVGLIALVGCTTENKDNNVVACTMEAQVCPDGSSVVRVAPSCEFTPCPSNNTCSCPEGYVQEGTSCNPECYYSTPKCLMPSIQCTTMNTQLANPASVNCVNNNGTLEIVDTNEGQVGMCTLPGGKVCEEWSYLRGEC